MTPQDATTYLGDRIAALEAGIGQLEQRQRTDQRRAELDRRDEEAMRRVAEGQTLGDL